MTLYRVTVASFTLALALAPVHTALAQRGGGARNTGSSSLFTWTGIVDREVILTLDGRQLFVQGDRVARGARNARRGGTSVRANRALPQARGRIHVQRLDGRGDIRVIEQPSARNGYVARIRIRDTRGGADRYRVRAFWEPVGRIATSRAAGGNAVLIRSAPGRASRNGAGSVFRDDRGSGGRNEGVRWSGVIDDVVDLHIRGRRVAAVVRSGAPVYAVRSTLVGNGLGRRDAGLRVVRADGRGRVAVIQQPAPWNGFTGIVRVVDRRGGAGRYALDIRW